LELQRLEHARLEDGALRVEGGAGGWWMEHRGRRKEPWGALGWSRMVEVGAGGGPTWSNLELQGASGGSWKQEVGGGRLELEVGGGSSGEQQVGAGARIVNALFSLSGQQAILFFTFSLFYFFTFSYF
jgi:hypothetical protein